MHDSHGAFDSASRALSRYLTQVGRRVLWFKLARSLGFASGAGLLLVAVCALLSGPNLGWLGAGLGWSAVVLGSVLGAAIGFGKLDDLAGERRALLIQGPTPQLSERARSAAALARAPNGSPELVLALTRGVVEELRSLPVSRAVAPPKHWGRMSSGSLLLALCSGFLLLNSEKAASGLYAMVHPGETDDHGTALGLWVSRVDARVTYPKQLERPNAELKDVRRIDVPEGSVVELQVRPRFDVERAVLKLGDHTLPLTQQKDGAYRVVLTAESSAALGLRARVNDRWVKDSVGRELVVAQDAAPVVDLDAPLADQTAAPDEPVPFVYRVSDDHGLESVDLVVQLGPGRERRVHLASFIAEPPAKRHAASTDVVPASFGARSGQTLAVWIEARDRDGFGGANVGRSSVRTITVGAEEDARGAPVELLERTRAAALDTLGERLEAPLATRSPEAGEREKKLGKTTRTLVRTLDQLANAYTEGTGDPATGSVLRDMTRRLSRLSREEDAATDKLDAKDLRKTDEAFVAELEDDVLWLSDLLGRAKLANASHSLERLAATRARMRELLEQLKKTSDPQQKNELMAEIARARAELAELSRKLSQAQTEVPSDFVNYEGLRAQADENPLEQLEQALARGDMEAAEKAMAALDEQLAGLENGLSEGSEAFADARFGPRNAAVERARSEIGELERTQKQLANETGRIADKARAENNEQSAFKQEADRLAQQAEALEQRARSLEAGRMQSVVSEAQASAAQRLRDARDALRQGDAQEARAMAERAADDLGGLSTEMMLDARMFPGPDGSRQDAARKANELAKDVSRFADEVAEAAPRGPAELSPGESQALKGQAPAQRGLGDKAGKLAQDVRDEAPPGLSERLGRATRSMRDAAGALERGDVREARAHQRDVLDRLGELNEELEKQARATGRGRREGEGSEQSGGSERVAIPEKGDDARRADLRRRVLDARRAQTPDAYEHSVERYYQEILR